MDGVIRIALHKIPDIFQVYGDRLSYIKSTV
jgi:hypothetical protein